MNNCAWLWMVAAMMMVSGRRAAEFNVQKYGAKADGKSDDSAALLKAWTDACKSVEASKLVIPKGSYMLGPVKFAGPCQGPITIQAMGAEFMAPADPAQFNGQSGWVMFHILNNFQLLGGSFNGNGATAWKKNDWKGESCLKSGKCSTIPINLHFYKITNSMMQGVTSIDSKQFHLNLLHCENFTLAGTTIKAPGDSSNTDGIHIGRSHAINITGASIQTGDDCISLGDGSQDISISGVRCGPGHGLAIGSLGRYDNEEEVRGVRVRNCTLANTMYGLRLKTWPSCPKPGVARDLRFEDIVMENVSTPVLIDQEYCPHNQCDLKAASSVKISDVSFRNIRGTSATNVVMKLQCSKGAPCEKVELADIDLEYRGPNGTAITECGNIKPLTSGKLVPPPCVPAAAAAAA